MVFKLIIGICMYEEMFIKLLDKEFEGNVLFRCKGGGGGNNINL